MLHITKIEFDDCEIILSLHSETTDSQVITKNKPLNLFSNSTYKNFSRNIFPDKIGMHNI